MSAPFAIGVDIGGTRVKAARVDARGAVDAWCAHSSRGGEDLIAIVSSTVAALAPDGAAVPIGVGAPGAIDPASGALVGKTPHLPEWVDFPLRERLRSSLGRDVAVDNDANLAALAEHRAGAARGARVSMTVTIGTGVGCGIVVDGRILRGAWGGAGELGHLPLGDGVLPCGCGVADCVEPEISGSGLVRAAAAAGLAASDPEAVFAAAARDEPGALALVDRFGDRLGAAIAAGVSLLNPDVVAIGGGVSGAGEPLLGRVRAAVERYAMASHRRSLRIVAAGLGERAGVVGAGLLALGA